VCAAAPQVRQHVRELRTECVEVDGVAGLRKRSYRTLEISDGLRRVVCLGRYAVEHQLTAQIRDQIVDGVLSAVPGPVWLTGQPRAFDPECLSRLLPGKVLSRVGSPAQPCGED